MGPPVPPSPPAPPSPPPSPPSPPHAPPPRTATAGDDPVFVGVDGQPYEIMGEPQRVFNLVSSPGFSINAHFATVPKRFKGEDITDTVLGTVGVAFCSVQGGALHVIFDVSSGNVTAYTSSDGHSGVHSREELISGTAAAALVRWGGAKMVHEQYICDLRWMDCSWMEANHDAPERTLPEVDSGHSRLLLRTSEV